MTTPETRFEHMIADLLDDLAPSRPPIDLIPEAQRAVDGARRWPRWLATLKEPPMRHASRVVVGSPTARIAALVAATLLAAVLGAGALVAGAQSSDTAQVETSAPPSAWVTGTVSGGRGGLVDARASDRDGVSRSRYHWRDMRIAMSDPRLSGTISAIYDQDVYTGAAGDHGTFLVGSGSYRIENEAGTWEGPNIFLNEGASGTATVSDTGLLVGSGSYEGLSAFLVFDMSQRPGVVVGAVFPGEVPPIATFE